MNTHTNFSSLAIVLSEKLMPNVKSKEKRLALLCKEKESTIKNWLYHGKIPPTNKRQKIADFLGVSMGYLFENGEFAQPVAFYHDELACYWVPSTDDIHIEQLFTLQAPLPVVERIPLRFRSRFQKVASPEKTWCLAVNILQQPPYINRGDLLFINPSAPVKDQCLCVCDMNGEFYLARFRECDSGSHFQMLDGQAFSSADNVRILPVISILKEMPPGNHDSDSL